MLIELPVDPPKQYQKLINRLNESYEKGKSDKISEIIDEMLKIIRQKPEDVNIVLYIISILSEEIPEYLNEDIISAVKVFLKESGIKEKTNAVIIVGTNLINSIESSKKNDQDLDDYNVEVSELVGLLENNPPEIRQNVCVFLDQIPHEFDNLFLTKLNFLIDILKVEDNETVLATLGQILLRIQKKLSLSILSNYIRKLTAIYQDSNVPAKSDLILKVIEKEIPILKEREQKKWEKKEILNKINKRMPLARVYDIQKIAKQEKMEESEVEEGILSGIDDEEALSFSFTDKNRKYIVEFEKEPLIRYISETKRRVDDLIKSFDYAGVKHQAILSMIIKDLTKKQLIKGFLSNQYYYPQDFLQNEVIQKLQRQGYIQIQDYLAFLSEKFVQKLLFQISEEGNYAGVYNVKKDTYYTFNFITKEIEQNVAKSNVIDMAVYSEKYEYEDFLRIEDFCRKNFFTPIHKRHQWLTNLGLTRIQTFLKTAEQIGIFDLKKAAGTLDIPEDILLVALKDQFEHKNGFWNEKRDIFYYGKYVKLQINKIQMQKDPVRRDEMIVELSKKLQIPKDELTKKVDEKLTKIAEMLSTKDEVEVNAMQKDLQMDYHEFINFIDGLERPYLVMHGKIIFSSSKIQEERKKLKETIKSEAKQNILNLNNIAGRVKCAKPLVNELFKELVSEKAIEGIWLDLDTKFITRSGIEKKMKESDGFFELKSFIENRDLDESEIAYLDSVAKNLIENHVLTGIYADGVFQTANVASEVNWTVERERFTNEIAPHLKDLEQTYDILKDILTADDISPSGIDEYEHLLEETIRKILQAEPYLKRILSNADRHIQRIKGVDKTKKGLKGKVRPKEPELEGEPDEDSFANDEVVAKLLKDLSNWKALILAIEQKAGQIVFLKKKLKANSQDVESLKTLKGIYEYLGFLD
jgi:hypothetical protein